MAGAVTVVPREVLGGAGRVPPSERLVLAHIGMGTQSIRELGGLLREDRIQIVAVCDPNRDSHDYIGWSRNGIMNLIRSYLQNPNWRRGRSGIPGGREVGREIIQTWYARQRANTGFSGVRTYADFRELLEKEKDLDAVKIMTPDHLHATIAVAALRRGLHVLMHKPVANRLQEARLVLETTRQTGKQSHLLAHGSATGNARLAWLLRRGLLGRLREIHNWTNRPVWPQYPEIPTDRPPIPPGFDWDLWLGPSLPRPYHPHYTHTVFRGWYEFGGGSMADMGIYSLWPVFRYLELPSPVRAKALATHACAIHDQVSRPIQNDWSYPDACTLRFGFPDAPDGPRPELFWYDGGMRPRFPDFMEAQQAPLEPEGILFIGETGAVLAGFHGENPRLYTPEGNRPLTEVEHEVAPSVTAEWSRSTEHWLKAFQGGSPSPGSFLNTGPISDTVNLGTVALRARQEVQFDPGAMRVLEPASADRLLRRDYRPGWELA